MRRLLPIVSFVVVAWPALVTAPTHSVAATPPRCYYSEVTIPPDHNPNTRVCPPETVIIGDHY